MPPLATAEALADERPVVTFSGLTVHQDGSSTLRVDLTKNTTVEFSQEGKNLLFVLDKARVALRTNTYPLRAEYFGSNVLRTKLNNDKTGVRLEIELRKPVTPTHRMISHAGGAVLRVDIPKQPVDEKN
jgi:hypothetical protein